MFEVRIPHASIEDFRRVVAANPDMRHELYPNGEIIVTPPAFAATGERNARLNAMLVSWAATHDYVSFDSSAGFRIAPRSVVSPDGALLRRATWEDLDPTAREDFPPLAPDVAVELISRSDRAGRVWKKLLFMRSLGTAYVVQIDPYTRTIRTDGVAPDGFDLDFTTLFA